VVTGFWPLAKRDGGEELMVGGYLGSCCSHSHLGSFYLADFLWFIVRAGTVLSMLWWQEGGVWGSTSDNKSAEDSSFKELSVG
jgi:hypothetical protein